MNYHAYPAFSFSGSKNFDFTIPNSSPGPKYIHQTNFDKLRSTKFGSSKRSIMGLSQTPHPGKYQHKVYTTQHQKVTIPKTTRQQNFQNFRPGPGTHDASEYLVKKRTLSYGFGYKTKSYFDVDSRNPGPAQYQNRLKTAVQLKNSRIGTGNRPPLSRDPSIPGVGNYQLGKTTLVLGKQTIGKSERPAIGNKNPGPGQYVLKAQIERQIDRKKGISMSSKLLRKPYQTFLESPGPKYDVQSKNDKPHYSVPKSPRRNNQFDSKIRTPGPFDYNLDPEQILKKSNSGTITKAKLQQTYYVPQTPGPGSYDIQTKFNPKYTFPRSQSLNFNSQAKNPSPAQYNINDAKDSGNKKRFVTIGTSQRYNFINKNKAGPGDYNISGDISKKSNGITIPKQPRKQNKNKNPGPAHYCIPSTISNLNKYSLYKSQLH